MIRTLHITLILVMIMGIHGAISQIPEMITYQGLLTDDTGSPVADGIYTLTFRIFDVATGGTALWTETQSNISTTGGLFRAFVGSVNPLTEDFHDQCWLEVQVGSGAPQTPRVTLTSVPYSYMSMDSDAVDGFDAEATPTANTLLALDGTGKFPADAIPSVPPTGAAGGDLSGTYPNPTIANNAVTTGKIENGAVRTVDLADESVSSIKIINSAVHTADLQDGAVTQAKLASDVTLPPGGTAGGDLTGTYPDPTIAANAVDSGKIEDGEVNTGDIANNAVTASKISPNIVSSIDGVTNDAGNIDFVAGSNITITPNDGANSITFDATGGGGGDITSVWPGDGTLAGGGDFGDVSLSVSNPFYLYGDGVLPEGVINGIDGSTGNAGVLGNDWRGAQGATGAGGSGPWGFLGGQYGAYGTNQDFGNYGYLGSGSYGVYGENMLGNYGCLGSNDHGVYGESYRGDYGYVGGSQRGLYGRNINGNWGSIGSNSYGVYYSGGLGGSGDKSCIVRTSVGPVALYCQESPESWFEDFGEGTLKNGRAHIELDALFLETVTIDEQNPMKVFVQLHDETCNGVAVKKGSTGFDVIELADGRSNGTFDYRIVAKRAGYETVRLAIKEEARNDTYLYPELKDTEAKPVKPSYSETFAGGKRTE